MENGACHRLEGLRDGRLSMEDRVSVWEVRKLWRDGGVANGVNGQQATDYVLSLVRRVKFRLSLSYHNSKVRASPWGPINGS